MTIDLIQRGDEWFEERLGSVGGSEIYDATAKLKSGGYSSKRKDLKVKKVLERIIRKQIGKPASGFSLQRGVDGEATARDAAAFVLGVKIREVGLFKHNRLIGAHSSPDGVIDGTNVAIEIKVPTSQTHYETLISDEVPEQYYAQCQWHMACGGFEAVQYISHDDRFPHAAQLFIKRIERDNDCIARLEEEAEKFIEEVNSAEAEFRARFMKGEING